MLTKNFENLTKEELVELRKEIILNSLFVDDYENSFGFDANHIATFFEGYVSYLEELANEDGFKYHTAFELFEKYESDENLWSWFNCYDDLSWVTFIDGYRVGDKVKWDDPAIDDLEEEEERESHRNRVYKIIGIINDEMLLIADDFSETEVLFSERISLAQ